MTNGTFAKQLSLSAQRILSKDSVRPMRTVVNLITLKVMVTAVHLFAQTLSKRTEVLSIWEGLCRRGHHLFISVQLPEGGA